MSKHIHGNVHLRHKRLPAGFKRYKKGQGVPSDVDPGSEYRAGSMVELMIRTAEGAGSSGIRQARFIDWDQGEGGMGEIVGFRIVKAGE
jgi:hypothetical protein